MPPPRFAANLDMYRKVPADLLEGTRRGSIMSTFAVVTMVTLFLLETKAFFTSTLVTDLALDSNDETRVRVNFNITMMDLRCEFATIDVVSVLGTQQNVTQHVTKWGIDAEGVRQRFQGRNLKQHDIELYDPHVTDTIEELTEEGEYAISLDSTTLKFAQNENEYLFVDFYASWCSHCRDLAPTWETLAQVMNTVAEAKVDSKIEEHDNEHEYSDEDYEAAIQVELPVMIAKVDCVTHKELCMEQQIRAYPTLRMFVDGEQHGDYRGHRTVVEMVHWVTEIEKEHKGHHEDEETAVKEAMDVAKERVIKTPEQEEWAAKMAQQRHHLKKSWDDKDHPGCQMSGFLMVDRAPGNFHIQAQSKSHDLAAHMTNVSHEIHHLSFGNPQTARYIERGLTVTPPDFLEATHPMDGNVYVTRNLHEAHHHYMKVITTEFDNPGSFKDFSGRGGKKYQRAYQILQSSQLSMYRNDIVPEAKFTYDLSPISVSYRKTSRHWYDYITSLMAIIGGTFTVVGMMESGMHSISSKKRR